jgi:hypothetical protein
MTREGFAAHLLQMHEQEKETRSAGQKEYAHDDGNAFRNFEETGNDINISREKALWVFVKKHMDGIKAHINGHTSQRESVHGRIKDARLYLALLDGMITEDERADEPLSRSGAELVRLSAETAARDERGDESGAYPIAPDPGDWRVGERDT